MLGNKDFITRGSITQDHALQHFLLASPKQCSFSVYNIKSEPHFHTTCCQVLIFLDFKLGMSSTSIVTINLYCDIIAAWIWVMEPMNIIMAYQGVAEKEKLHESVVNPLECWFSGSTYQYVSISQGIH